MANTRICFVIGPIGADGSARPANAQTAYSSSL